MEIPKFENDFQIRESLARVIEFGESVKKHIYSDEHRMKFLCKTISLISLIAEIIFFVGAALFFIIVFLVQIGVAKKFILWQSEIPSATLNLLLPAHTILAKIGHKENTISLSAHICFIMLTLLWGISLNNFRLIFKNIASGMRPFEKENIKKLKLMAIIITCMGIIQPVFFLLGILLFAIMQVFKYGNVIQQKADSTINDQEGIIFSLAEITENKSGQTGQHIKRVCEYSKILAEGMGLSPEKVEEIRLASVLHDIGKLMIDSKVLDKPGKLSGEEFQEIKKHVIYGENLLSGVDGEVLKTAQKIARDHHERFDGSGYATGILGEEISIEGRIVAVADVFDALTSKRSYKSAWTCQEAFEEICSKSGTQFDPQIIKAFKEEFPKIIKVQKKFSDEVTNVEQLVSFSDTLG